LSVAAVRPGRPRSQGSPGSTAILLRLQAGEDRQSPPQSVDLCGQNEIGLHQAVDLVRPDGDRDLAPGEVNRRVVALFLGYFTDSVDKLKSGLEVREMKEPVKVMALDNLPSGHFALQTFQFLALKRRHAASAGFTTFRGQFGHRSQPPFSAGGVAAEKFAAT
jgi:hypothetical protein